jgi:Ran GTPase-activating protein (RanGAP) involved in mRNA processing and transport
MPARLVELVSAPLAGSLLVALAGGLLVVPWYTPRHLVGVANRMSTDEKVIVRPNQQVDMHHVSAALMADNVCVKKLSLRVSLSIGDADTLRDALHVNTSVKELNLGDVTVDCFLTLAQGMTVGQNVKKLSLYNVHLDTEDDLIPFQSALRSIAPFVEDIDLSYTDLGDTGARVLAEILREGNSFRELKLYGCNIGSIGAAHIGGALRVNTSIQVLDLSWNNIGNVGVISLVEGMMNNQNLRVLNLDNCDMVGSQGAAAVARLLESNATIEELGLSNNKIGDDGCIALADGLSRNQGLRVLSLRLCQVGNEGAEQFGLTMKFNDHIERLDLGANLITEEGFVALAEGLSCNTTLLDLDLSRDYVGHINEDYHLTETLASWIGSYLSANRLLHRYRSRGTAIVSPFLLSIILARVAEHPAVHNMFTREYIPGLVASSSATRGDID